MSEHDHLKKQSWFTEKAPTQREPKENLFGDAHVGSRTRTQDMVNPNVPVAESAFVKLARAKKSEQQESAGGSAVEHVQRAATESGSPLPDEVRGKFEASLGADLSGVRVHTGAASATAAESVGAKAYTTGQDIHFGAAHYDPSSKEGQRLLGHEVAHTVQQGSASPAQPQAKLEVSAPADAHEQEADSAAEAMLVGAPASVSRASIAGVIARSPDDACSVDEPNRPLVCAPPTPFEQGVAPTPFEQGLPPVTEEQVPAPFDIPVAEQCMLPPPARDWSTAPAIGACPTEPMVGGPGYKPEYVASNLDTYKSAFNTSWSELQTGYNVVVDLNRSYNLKEKEVIPLLHVGGGVVVSGGGQNATKSFDGDKLKPSATKVDTESVNAKPGLREQLLNAKDKIGSAERAVNVQLMTAEQLNGAFVKTCNAVDTANNNVDVVGIEKEIANAQLDKEHVKRELENYKADIKAVVETAKMASSLWSAWANPTKIFDAFNQTMNAGGALSEREATHDANKKLDAIDGKIRGLQNGKYGLLLKNAKNALSSALVDMHNALIELRKASETLKDRKQDYQRAYRDMASLMEQAGTASGMKSKDARALKAAVEAVPKIEAINQQLEGMNTGVTVPKYNEDSGIGAAMCSNLSAFTYALGVVKGNKDYIAELKALWEGRRASVQMVIEKALTVEGAEW